VSFRNAIVIMTSNVGSQFVTELAKSGDYDQMKVAVEEALRQTFRPEFLNRIDDIVVFHQLTMEQVAEIAELQLERVKQRLSERRITLEIEPAALERIALDGFDPVYGARPLKRVIQREVVDRIAKALVAGEVRDGDTVVIDLIDDEIGIRAVRHEAAH